jgi:hypothetical protein
VTVSDRGQHPDLVDEEPTPATPEPPERPARSGSRNGRRAEPPPQEEPAPEAAQAPEAPAEPTGDSGGEHAAPTEPPEWLTQARQESDPEKMLAILAKNMPRDTLQRDETLAGLLGSLADRRARALLAQQEQQRIERERQEAFQRGDLYTLGQYTSQELQAQHDQQQQAAQLDTSPFMTGVRQFQAQLPIEVQQEVQGKTYAPDGTPADGVAAYLKAITEASIRHGFDAELKRREPALRKRYLSETVGSAPAPVLEGGRAPTIREITDVQLAAMNAEETAEVLDEKGQVRPGYALRLTRGVDLRSQR